MDKERKNNLSEIWATPYRFIDPYSGLILETKNNISKITDRTGKVLKQWKTEVTNG